MTQKRTPTKATYGTKGAPGARLVLSVTSFAATIIGWAMLTTQAAPNPSVASATTQMVLPPAWLTEPLVLPTLMPLIEQTLDTAAAPVVPVPAPVRELQAPLRQVQLAPPPIILTSSSR